VTYDFDFFIDKFEAIPENNWCTGTFLDAGGRCCALGHCGSRRAPNGNTVHTEEGSALRRLSPHSISMVNDDGYCRGAKGRVVALLKYLKTVE